MSIRFCHACGLHDATRLTSSYSCTPDHILTLHLEGTRARLSSNAPAASWLQSVAPTSNKHSWIRRTCQQTLLHILYTQAHLPQRLAPCACSPSHSGPTTSVLRKRNLTRTLHRALFIVHAYNVLHCDGDLALQSQCLPTTTTLVAINLDRKHVNEHASEQGDRPPYLARTSQLSTTSCLYRSQSRPTGAVGHTWLTILQKSCRRDSLHTA